MRIFGFFLCIFVASLLIDQGFKLYMLSLQAEQSGASFKEVVLNLELGFSYASLWQSEFIDLKLVLNKGVAFSLFAFLQEHLKWFHLGLLIAIFGYLLWQKDFLRTHLFAFGLMLGSGTSNLLDRFLWGGVVDMFFWHKWFHFAIFNLADVFINISVVLILWKEFITRKK